MPRDLQAEAVKAIQSADFRDFWPLDVRKAVVRAAQHDGDFPPFGEKEARWALKEARSIEQRFSRDVAVGEATLSQAQRRNLAVAR